MGGGDQLVGVELRAVIAAGQPADRLLHQRAAEVVDAPAQRLGCGVEAHLHPRGLQARDRAAERQAEDGRVLEVLLARDLLHAMGSPEQRLERDERQRHELGDAAGPLLQLAHHAHVLGQLPRLLDVAEHDGRGRAQAGAVRGLDDLAPSARPAACSARSARARRRAAPRRRCRASSRDRRRAAARTPPPARSPEMSHMCAISIGL